MSQKEIYQRTLNTVDLLSKKQVASLAKKLGMQQEASRQEVKTRLQMIIRLS